MYIQLRAGPKLLFQDSVVVRLVDDHAEAVAVLGGRPQPGAWNQPR